MFRGFIVGILFTIALGVLAAYLVLRSGMIPANADATPGQLERFAARTSLRATLANEAPKGPNPVALTDANLIQGVQLYGSHCAVCHGLSDGVAGGIAKGEYPKPPQFAHHGVEDDPEGVSFWKIKHGVRWTGMPSWKDEVNDQQIWTLALFLKHMDKLPPAAETAWRGLHRGTASTPSGASGSLSPSPEAPAAPQQSQSQ